MQSAKLFQNADPALFKTKKGTNYYGLPSIIFTKLTSQDCPYLLCERRRGLGILNVRYIHWQVIQGSQCQIKPYHLPRHYYCIGYGCWSLFTCLPANNLALRWKSSILTSKIIWQFTRWYPIGIISPLSNFLKVGLAKFISLARESAQTVFPLFLFRAYSSATVLCTSIPNLCVFLR